MSSNEIIFLQRDVNALLIPSGARIYLQQGTEVTITQSLGGSYTVNIYGNLARIDNKDADALGKPVQLELSQEELENSSLEDLVWSQMKTCYDPEIPVNIVDLGLIYECNITELPDQSNHVLVKMTLTAPGCGRESEEVLRTVLQDLDTTRSTDAAAAIRDAPAKAAR